MDSSHPIHRCYIVVYSIVCCCMFKMDDNPQEVKLKRPLVTILIVSLFVIAFSVLLFLVSVLSRFRWSPPKTGPPGLSAVHGCAVSGPPGPKIIATFGPPARCLVPLPIQKLLARSCKNLTQFMQAVSCTYPSSEILQDSFRIDIWAPRILHSTAKSCSLPTSKVKKQDFLQESAGVLQDRSHHASMRSRTMTTPYPPRMTIHTKD